MARSTGVVTILVVALGVSFGCTRPMGAQLPSRPSTQVAIQEATRLGILAAKLYSEGKFQEAFPLVEQTLALREKALGPRHPDVAKSLNNLAGLYQAQGAYTKAEALFVRALDIREKVLGPMHPDVADSLNNLAGLYQAQGLYIKARPLYLRALDIREKTLGPMHPDVADSVDELGILYSKQGAYAKAEPLFLRALDIREKALDAMHPDVSRSLHNIASLYIAEGDYTKAEPLLVRALDADEKALGAMHPTIAARLNNLAAVHMEQGAYTKAEPLLIRALNINKKAKGALHPDIATNLHNLAYLYQAQGKYANAEPLLIQALDIDEKALGTMHPDVALRLNTLAALYMDQNAYTKAEPLLVRALDIEEKALGATHPEVAASLNNLATLYEDQGEYTKAEPLLLRSLDINEKVLGAMHRAVANNLSNLARVYSEQSVYAKAEPLYIRALDINIKALGATHPDVATVLDYLAMLYQKQGEYTKAESLHIRALDIRETALGPMRPDVAQTLRNLGALYRTQGVYAKAEPLFARAVEIQEAKLRLELAQLSEPRKRALMMQLQKETNSVVSLHADAMPSSAQALELALTTILRRKSRVLDSLADNQRSLHDHLTPVLRDNLDQLVAAKVELSARLHAAYDPRTTASRTEAIAALRARIDDLESALNAASADFRAQSEPITIAKIRAALPRRATLVEFVRYDRIIPHPSLPGQESRYVAYFLPWQGPPQWVALGEAAPIDAAVDTVLAAMHRGASQATSKTALQHLDTLVFAPLRGRLTGVSHVILSPDSKLNLVPFEALIDPQGHYELEQQLVSYVTSGRDLLRLAARRAPRSPATIVAAPHYGPPHSPAVNGVGTFRPLDGATAEAAELPAYFLQPQTLTGDKATKSALAATVGPAVLHIATHGFYARDTAATVASPDKSTGSVPPAGTSAAASKPSDSPRGIYLDEDAFFSAPPPPLSEDPTDALDRAGLALAGANTSPEGIVSARELASYDWWGTQLVVLSACETGVGAVPSGEGVYGMRRALVLAGAESQVVSLWNVSDTSTRELMRAFYGELARGTGRAEALRRAKLQMLRQPRFAHPYYWAAFIPAGAWTPLDPHILKHPEHNP